jgi:hypothetical protein
VRLLKKCRERACLSGEEKHALLEENAYSCALCGQKGRMEWDHTNRFSEGFGPQVMQALCRQCHLAKTAAEPQDLDGDPLVSHFEKSVWDAYVLSPRSPPLVWKVRELDDVVGCRISDVRRCRKRALECNVHRVPVFSPLDGIEETGTTLGDIVFCSRPSKNIVALLGYTGPGWMHRCQAEFLLHHGVVKWQDLPYKLTASGYLPADVFRKPLQLMEFAWGEAGHLAKQSINSMIGLWCLDEAYSYKLMSSESAGDIPEGAFKLLTQFPGGCVTDIILKTHLTSTTSMRPLQDLTLCTEAVRVGQMLHALKRQRSVVYQMKTDSCLFRSLQRARTEVLESLTFRGLDLRERFEPCRGERRLDDYHPLVVPSSEELVYKVQDATPQDLMQMNPGHPKRDASYAHTRAVMRELDQEEATRRVLAGESLLIEGIAGTGKSYFAQQLVQALRAQGKSVAIMSKTHTASSRIGGCTADHWVRRHILNGAATADVLWVDECYQLETNLWSQLNRLSGRQFILSGDPNQFAPLFDSWRGVAVPEDAFQRSNLLLALAQCNRLTLTRCMRSDVQLFSFYASIIPGGSRFSQPLADVLAEARATFCRPGPALQNLCISHRKRHQLNKEANERERLAHKAVYVKGDPGMWVWPGLVLFGSSGGRKTRNGLAYEVESIGEDSLVAGGVKLPFANLAATMRLPRANTYASCQGTEYPDTLAINDTDNPHFSRRHLFVALSRAKEACNVCVK